MPDTTPNGTPAASADRQGQQPTAANGNHQPPTTSATSSADPTTQQTPAANASSDETSDGQGDPTAQQQQQQQVQNPEAKKYADEAAKYRKELRDAQKRISDFEAAQKAADDAKLSKEALLEKRVAEYQAKEAQATLSAQERILKAEVRAEAIAKGVNPALAARIVDFAAIEFDEDSGDPKNIGDLLAKAIADYGITPAATSGAQQQQQQPPAPNAGGATNPPRQNNGPLAVTANQFLDAAFNAQFYKDYGMDLTRAANLGKVKII